VSNWRSLLDGKTHNGWFAAPPSYGTVAPGGPAVITPDSGLPLDYNARAAEHPAIWTVEDGAIVGRQAPDAPGWGGYLVSEESFGSFELELEMRPDWPADTGVMIRRRRDSWEGLQVLVDHRRSGSIGGVYGNGIGGFHGVPFAIDAATDARGRPIGLIEDDPATSLEEFTEAKRAMLTRAGSAEEFLAAWRWNDWNSLRIRCEGTPPLVTTWVNDVLVAEVDCSSFTYPGYEAGTVWNHLEERGHLAFEVHDNDPRMGEERWGRGAACRWRDVRIRKL
jgi:hypothetical protein